jgi:hypothetical protein
MAERQGRFFHPRKLNHAVAHCHDEKFHENPDSKYGWQPPGYTARALIDPAAVDCRPPSVITVQTTGKLIPTIKSGCYQVPHPKPTTQTPTSIHQARRVPPVKKQGRFRLFFK